MILKPISQVRHETLRISFLVFKLTLSKVFGCMQLMLGIYLYSEMFIANPPCGFTVYVKIHTVIIEADGILSALNTLGPVSI